MNDKIRFPESTHAYRYGKEVTLGCSIKRRLANIFILQAFFGCSCGGIF